MDIEWGLFSTVGSRYTYAPRYVRSAIRTASLAIFRLAIRTGSTIRIEAAGALFHYTYADPLYVLWSPAATNVLKYF